MKKWERIFFTPGWTSYNKRTLYQIYDVTDMLLNGADAVVTIGSGWYKGNWDGARRNLYGGREALILELHLYYKDGTKEKILSDSSWQSLIRSLSCLMKFIMAKFMMHVRKLILTKQGCKYESWLE
ncbi:MAG: alpha-L-rhamnosidase N-terminal domain-containing protein [Blautia sp.]